MEGVGSRLGADVGNTLSEGREVGTGPETGELVVGVWLHVGAVLGKELDDGPGVGMDDSSNVGKLEGDTTVGGVPIESSLGVLEGNSLELGTGVGVCVTNAVGS
jgi:hypothetical protein